MGMSDPQYFDQVTSALNDAGNRLESAQYQFNQATVGSQSVNEQGGESQSKSDGTLYAASCKLTGVEAEIAALQSAPA
jgi:hypothetical protein